MNFNILVYIQSVYVCNSASAQMLTYLGEAETPILWPCDVRRLLLEKILMLVKTEGRRRSGQQRKRWLNGIPSSMDMSLRKFQKIDSERQESLACCSPWGGKESDMTHRLQNKVNDGH